MKISSTADKLGIDLPRKQQNRLEPSPPLQQTKPILKHRSISDILAASNRESTLYGTPIYEEVVAKNEVQEVNAEVTLIGILQRPPLWHTKSDSFVLRNHLSSSPQNLGRDISPGYRKSEESSLSPPDYGSRRHSGRRSDSSSSYQVSDDSHSDKNQRSRPKRHISFNSFVEQRIVIEPSRNDKRLSTVYARRSSSESGSDEDDEGTALEMRSSSGSSLSSTRRGSLASSSEANTPKTVQMTMITAPFPPTLLKEDDELPAPSPAVVFVAPQGVDQERLRYEAAVSATSRASFGYPDRRRRGSASTPPVGWIAPSQEGEWYEGGDSSEDLQPDYFSGIPQPDDPTEPPRESIYTDEDEDAITVRRRKAGNWSPGLPPKRGPTISSWLDSQNPTPDLVLPSSRRSSTTSKQKPKTKSIPQPTIAHQENFTSGVPIRRIGSASDVRVVGFVGSAPTQIIEPRSNGREYQRGRSRGTSFEGVALEGNTSALSSGSGAGRTEGRRGRGTSTREGGGGLARSQSAALISPTPEGAGDRSQRSSAVLLEELERPRRGRSLLRTNSSSTISERERSSTGGSASPLGSLSPRSSSSVGIVGGIIVQPATGSRRGGSALRFVSGSWSAEDERTSEDGDSKLESVVVPPPKQRPSGLVRVGSSGSIATKPVSITSNNVSLSIPAANSLSAPIRKAPVLEGIRHLNLDPSLMGLGTIPDAILSGSSGSTSGASSFWRGTELEGDSSVTPPSIDERQKPVTREDVSIHRDLLLARNPIKPRASGASLASSASNGSNSSATTVVPNTPTQAVSARNRSRSSPLVSASSSVSSNASVGSHRRTSSRSSINGGSSTPPMGVLSTAPSSVAPRLVSSVVATRMEVGSPPTSATATAQMAAKRHSRRISGTPSLSGQEDKAASVSPGSMLSGVVVSAKGLLGAFWGGNTGE